MGSDGRLRRSGLAVAIAFRTGLFNIGVEGQFIVGQMTAIIVGLKLPLPAGLHAAAAVIAGGLAGALWAYLPGWTLVTDRPAFCVQGSEIPAPR